MSRYEKIIISGSNEPLKHGLVYMPYLVVESKGPSKEYEEFMFEYNKLHATCPKCRALSFNCTLMGHVLDMSKKENYKDLNTCTCLSCGDIHTVHERIEL